MSDPVPGLDCTPTGAGWTVDISMRNRSVRRSDGSGYRVGKSRECVWDLALTEKKRRYKFEVKGEQ